MAGDSYNTWWPVNAPINTGITGISAVNAQVVELVQTTAPNTTTACYLECTYQAAAATTTCTFKNAIIEVIQP